MKIEVGKRYEVIAKLDWVAKGSVVKILAVREPLATVRLIVGWVADIKTSEPFIINTKQLKPIEETIMKTANQFPDYSFKVSTEGFNKEELKAAYQWLKECAISKNIRYGNIRRQIEAQYYYTGTQNHVEWDYPNNDNYPELPKIKLNIETVSTVTGYTLVEPSNEVKLKKLITKLEQTLEEANNQLVSLNSINEKV